MFCLGPKRMRTITVLLIESLCEVDIKKLFYQTNFNTDPQDCCLRTLICFSKFPAITSKIQCFKSIYIQPWFRGIRIHTVKVVLSMIFSFFHHFKSKYPINLPQKLSFFGPDFATHFYPSRFWVRYIQNDVPRHARAQNFAPIGVFWI